MNDYNKITHFSSEERKIQIVRCLKWILNDSGCILTHNAFSH